MKLSTSANYLYDTTYKVPYTRMIERIASFGFKYYDLAFCDFQGEGAPLLQDNWEEWAYKIKETIDSLDVSFGQAHAAIYSLHTKDETSRYFDKITIRSMEAAKIVGSPWMVFHTTNLPEGFNKNNKQKTIDANKRYYEKMLKVSQRTGVKIALENIPSNRSRDGKLRRNYCNDYNELIEIVDYFNSPNMGICLDTGHSYISGYEPAELALAFGKRLKVLHVQDNDGYSDQHLAPFQGKIDWYKFMHALKEINYTGTFNYEVQNYCRHMPDCLKDEAISLLFNIGQYLMGIYDKAE